jgi:hypothetical protein
MACGLPKYMGQVVRQRAFSPKPHALEMKYLVDVFSNH